MTHGQAVRELCAMLQRTYDVASPVELFRGFVSACHLALDDLPALLHYALTRQSIAAPDSRGRWGQAMGRFTPATIEAFARGFAVLLDACHFLPPEQSYDHADGPDIIGSVYMDLLSGRSNKWNYSAQFFTPWTVAYAMALMSGAGDLEARFHTAVKPHLADNPVLLALTLAATIGGPERYWWWLSQAWPRLKAKIEPVRICDPCVGSGILLLAHAACHPRWLVDIGYVQYAGGRYRPAVRRDVPPQPAPLRSHAAPPGARHAGSPGLPQGDRRPLGACVCGGRHGPAGRTGDGPSRRGRADQRPSAATTVVIRGGITMIVPSLTARRAELGRRQQTLSRTRPLNGRWVARPAISIRPL
jgi:hypothetical protein